MTARRSATNSQKPRAGRPSAEEAALISDRILDAAWTIVVDQGPDALSFDRLAAAAAAGKATIYARFPSKVILARAVLEQRIMRVEQQFDADLPRGDDFESELAQLAERVAGLMAAPEGRSLERLVDWLALSDDQVGKEARAWLYGRSTSRVAEQLTRIAGTWGVRIAEPEVTAQFWLESVFGHARMCHGSEGVDDWPRRHARAIARAFSA